HFRHLSSRSPSTYSPIPFHYNSHTLSTSFSSVYRYRPDLHSFPTRRSSDLPTSTTLPTPPTGSRRSRRPTRCCRTRRSAPCTTRSEEHTSELQSRFDLVCRLLLEKKNIISIY